MESGSQRRPVWQPSRLSRLKSVLSQLLGKITFVRFALAVVILPLLLYVYREVTRDALIIDPFSVPKRFEEAGLTSDVMANRIGDKLRQIEVSARTRRKKDNLASLKDEASIPEVEIPGTKLGLKTVIDITRSVFAIYPKHVSGDVVILANDSSNTKAPTAVKQQATVTTYVTEGRSRSSAMSVTSDAEDVGLLVQRAAETVLRQINPYVLAVYEYDQGDRDKALGIVEGMIDNPSEARGQKAAAFSLWGLALHEQHRYDEAIAKYQKAIELDPKFAFAYDNWGVTLQEQHRYDEAIANYQKAIELDPKFADAYDNWGAALQEQHKYDEAIANYQKAIELDPKFAYAYDNWGLALQEQHKYDEAIANYQKAIELDPKFAYAYENWGAALQEQHKYDEAIANYQKAIELDPKFAYAYDNWGLALQEQHKYDEAIANYQKAIELDPKFAYAYENWGAALQEQHKYDEAIAKYQKAIELDPKLAAAYNNWGYALQEQHKDDEAIAKYQKAIELDPKFALAYDNWGLALKEQGKNDEANQLFEKASRLR